MSRGPDKDSVSSPLKSGRIASWRRVLNVRRPRAVGLGIPDSSAGDFRMTVAEVEHPNGQMLGEERDRERWVLHTKNVIDIVVVLPTSVGLAKSDPGFCSEC
jgi:hypothetical protein